MWIGPAPVKPFNRNRFHYNWHWQWDYGNGDTGNQGPHQFDIARWGLGKNEHPVKVSSMGGYFGEKPSAQETPDMQTALFEYADGTIMEFGTRGEHTPDEGASASATSSSAPRAGCGSKKAAAGGSPTWARSVRGTRRARDPRTPISPPKRRV